MPHNLPWTSWTSSRLTLCSLLKTCKSRSVSKVLHLPWRTIEEDNIGYTGLKFPGGDDKIITEAIWTTTENNAEEDTEDEGDEVGIKAITEQSMKPTEAWDLCTKMEKVCLDHSDTDGVSLLELQKQSWRLCAHLRHLVDESHIQTSLYQFWGSSPSHDKDVLMSQTTQ
jgi:hypothetical protein